MNLKSMYGGERLETYKSLKDIDSDNFFFVLASRLAPILLNKKLLRGDSKGELSYNILGNSVVLSYPSMELQINGVHFKEKGTGLQWLKSIIVSIFREETLGNIVIKRPKSMTRKKERLEFKKAEGTFFPTIVNSVAYATGEQDYSIKGTTKNKLFLTARQYESALNKKDFIKEDNGKMVYYIRRGSQLIDTTDYCSIKAIKRAFIDPDNNLDILARTPGLYTLYAEPNPNNPIYIVVSGEHAMLAESYADKVPVVKDIK